MDYAEAIKQDMQAILLTEDIEVTVLTNEEDSSVDKEMIRFGILIGKGKKGGLLFSADVHKSELSTAVNNCILMIKSQLGLYAIACIKKGYEAKLDDVFIPNITHTLVFHNNEEAKNQSTALATLVGAFNIFQGTPFNGDKIPKVAKTKSIKKVIKKKTK